MEDKKYRTIEVKPDECVLCTMLTEWSEIARMMTYAHGGRYMLAFDVTTLVPDRLCNQHRTETKRDLP
jgi:hypothetical protein